MSELPILGAAMRLASVEFYRDWLFALPRPLELQDFVEAAVLEGDWSPLVAEAKRLLDGHDGPLGIHGPFRGLPLASPDHGVRGIVATRLAQALDVAEALGATQIVIHSPYTTWMHNNLDQQTGQRDQVIEFVRLTLEAALKRAEDAGISFVLENIEDKDPADRRRMVEAIDSKALTLSLDTGHAAYAHGSTGAPPVDYYVRDAGALLEHVHLQDADGYADRHWSLGRGVLPWHAILAALGDTGAKPRLIIEIRDKALIGESARYLTDLGLAR